VRGYKGKNGRHGRRAAKEAGRPPGDYDGRMGAAARRARVSLGARWLAAAVAGAACLTVLVPLGSLAGRTECRSRYSRRAPHEPLFRIHGPSAHGCCAPIPPPRPARQSDTGPRCCWPAGQTPSQHHSARRELRQTVQTSRRRCSPSSCACNGALSGRLVQRVAHPILRGTNQEAVCPPPLDESQLFHTRFDHARSGLIDRQPITSCLSAVHACRFDAAETQTRSLPPDVKDLPEALTCSTPKPPSAVRRHTDSSSLSTASLVGGNDWRSLAPRISPRRRSDSPTLVHPSCHCFHVVNGINLAAGGNNRFCSVI
jgi:hypothetical protein